MDHFLMEKGGITDSLAREVNRSNHNKTPWTARGKVTSMSTTMKSNFCLGQIVATPRALEALQRNQTSGYPYLRRHASGDWGNVSDEDAHLNDMAVEDGSRILSAYLLPDETKLWIITDATVDDKGTREVTTILLPEDY